MTSVPTPRTRALADVRSAAVAAGLNRVSAVDTSVRLSGLAILVAGATCLAVSVRAPWAVLSASMITSYAFLALPTIAHGGVHAHLAGKARTNRVIGLLASAVALVPYSTYRWFHIEHHAYAATERDSEQYPPRFTTLQFLSYPIIAASFVLVLWRWSLATARGAPPRWVRTERQRGDVVIDTALTVMIAAILLATVMAVGGPVWAIWPGSLPLAAVLYGFTILPEHFGARGRVQPTSDQLGYTATIQTGRLTSALLWNSNLHAAHHFMPSIPAAGLPELDAMIASHQPDEWRCRGYIRWWVRTLRALHRTPWNAPLTDTEDADDG